jgi:hypothetical protein
MNTKTWCVKNVSLLLYFYIFFTLFYSIIFLSLILLSVLTWWGGIVFYSLGLWYSREFEPDFEGWTLPFVHKKNRKAKPALYQRGTFFLSFFHCTELCCLLEPQAGTVCFFRLFCVVYFVVACFDVSMAELAKVKIYETTCLIMMLTSDVPHSH